MQHTEWVVSGLAEQKHQAYAVRTRMAEMGWLEAAHWLSLGGGQSREPERRPPSALSSSRAAEPAPAAPRPASGMEQRCWHWHVRERGAHTTARDGSKQSCQFGLTPPLIPATAAPSGAGPCSALLPPSAHRSPILFIVFTMLPLPLPLRQIPPRCN
jgi:hypothetical protein